MNEKYLAINAGSSSLKFTLYEMPESKEIVNGYFQKIGREDSFYTLKLNGVKEKKIAKMMSHSDAINIMFKELISKKLISDINEIKGVGHRILHGGEFYSDSVIITDDVLRNIKSLTKLGPLHHPSEISGIKSISDKLPDVPQVAVFDTAFHQTMPLENYLYAVPFEWYKENGVRKYGFHGTSHKYITEEAKKIFNKEDVNLIICHIGSGSSISCVKNGKCFDTSMGLTPLDGLVMCTRSGSIDPSILSYVCKERNLTIDQVNEILNKKSGMYGITGDNDYLDIENKALAGDEKAKLAVEKFELSIAKYIADYYLKLGGKLDALIFTAGVGENSTYLREDIVKYLRPLGIELDETANNLVKQNNDKNIVTNNSKFKVLVIPTNEELMIIKDTYNLIQQNYDLNKSNIIRR